jgi:antitoxin (DNA-binding transcriptional repressor) of toxin-antitoxin stability system
VANVVSVYEAKAHLSRLIDDVVKSRRPVTICRHKKPVVDLVAHKAAADPLRQDPKLRGAVYRGNPCAGANESDWPKEAR